MKLHAYSGSGETKPIAGLCRPLAGNRKHEILNSKQSEGVQGRCEERQEQPSEALTV
jgi:hypothetical protein